MAPKLILLMSSGSKKKEPRFACLSEDKASHSQRMWAERFLPLLHTSYTVDCLTALVSEDDSSGYYVQ
jgi:hypothetical protein